MSLTSMTSFKCLCIYIKLQLFRKPLLSSCNCSLLYKHVGIVSSMLNLTPEHLLFECMHLKFNVHYINQCKVIPDSQLQHKITIKILQHKYHPGFIYGCRVIFQRTLNSLLLTAYKLYTFRRVLYLCLLQIFNTVKLFY